MGSLSNQYISSSYQGLLKLTDSTTGVTATLQSIQDGIGGNTPLQISQTQVNITGSLTVNSVPVVAVNTGSFVTTGSFNAYTSSNDSKVNSLIAATSSYAIQTGVTALSSSIATTDLGQNNRLGSLETATGSLQTQINQKLNSSSFNSYTSSNDGRVSSLESKTGSYATTGSNQFKADQTITGSLTVTGTVTAASASFTYLTTVYETSSVIFSSGSNILGDASNDTQTLYGTVKLPNGPLSVTGSVVVSGGITGDLTGTASYATNAATASYFIGTIPSASYAVTSSISFDLVVYGKCDNPGGLTKGTIVRITGASGDNPLFNSASWTDDANSANTLGMLTEDVAYNAFANIVTQGTVIGINTNGMTAGDMLYLSSSGQYTTSSVPAPYHEVRLGQVLRPQLNNGSAYISIDNGYELTELHDVDITSPVSGDLLVYRSGSYGQWVNETGGELGFATTGSNAFKGSQVISGSVNMSGSLNLSGSLWIKNQGNTGLDYVTQSAENIANIYFGANGSYSTNSGSFVITGSNNLVTAQFPRTVGYTNYINGHGNIMLGSAGLLLSTSSIAVSTAANIGGGSYQLQFGTSSLAAPVVGNNYIQSVVTMTSPSGSINAINNNFLGAVTYRATGTTHNSLSTMTNNMINSTPVFNAVSSSIAATYNTFGGGTFTFNNNYTSSNATGNQMALNRNAIFGNSHIINASGSNDGSTSFGAFNDNLIAGTSNTVNRSAVGTSSGSLVANGIIGNGLIVSSSGRAGGNDAGSVFFGRWNDTAQGLSESTTTVLAVGTGTATGTRRTSLHVSSSGLFSVRDGMNVTGSLNTTGSLVVSGSIASTKSFAQVTLASNQTVTAGADATINFDTTDFDPNSWWNSGSKIFQPTIAGYYEFTAEALVGTGTGTGQMNMQLNKNSGTQVFIYQSQININQPQTIGFSKILFMNGSTDNVKVTFYTSSGSGSQDVTGGNGTLFNVKLL